MKLRIAALAAVAALAAGLVFAASRAEAQGVPGGSYLQSCRNIQVQDDRDGMGLLLADCPDGSGRWNQTGIRFRTCRGDIANRGGRLVCSQGGYRGEGYDDGRYNDRGYGDGGYGGGSGYGGNTYDRDYGRRGFQQYGHLRLYEAFGLNGAYFEVTREITNLPRQYNDRARSISISGRGTWQVCSDSDFRGRCVIVDGQVRDLRSLGMADTISSIRQIR